MEINRLTYRLLITKHLKYYIMVKFISRSKIFFSAQIKTFKVSLCSFLSAVFMLFMVNPYHSQNVQVTQASAGDEQHFSLTEPSSWEGDYFVSGTMNSAFFGRNARFKRVKADGNITWDFNMTADDMENRAMHVIASDWGGGDATVFGFMDEGEPEALIYGVLADGTIVAPYKLTNVNGANSEATTFLHGTACSDGGWIAVGEWKSGFNRSGLVVKFSASGVIEWSHHLDSPKSNVTHDFDALNHVLEIDGMGYFIGGSGNFIDPSNNTIQAASAAMIDLSGSLSWGFTYVHSEPAYESVAASAVQTDSGKLYQIVNGRGDVTFIKNGFSIHEIDLLSGGLGAVVARNLHIQEHPLKAMSVRQHPLISDRIVVAGFLEVDANDIGYEPNDPPAYGILAGDRPPFLMEIDPGVSEPGVSCISWHHVYDVPSTLFGLTMPVDRYNVFSTFGDQPQIFHPEMLLTNESGEFHLLGYRDVNGIPDEFDLEFIGADSLGLTECPTYQANIIELERSTAINSNVVSSLKDYQLFSFQPDIYDLAQELMPCDACFPEVSVMIDSLSCDAVVIEVVPVDDDPASVCYTIDWGDGVVTSASGGTSYAHDWAEGVTDLTIHVAPYCCDLPSLMGSSHVIHVTRPDGCDCVACNPWMRSCQVNFDNPVISFPSSSTLFPGLSVFSLFDCPSGCDEAPFVISVSLGSFIVSPFGSTCLDDVSGVWFLNGIQVQSFICGDYAPISLTVPSEGSYEIEVVLTNCADESCTSSLSDIIEVGNCVPPANPKFDILDGGVIPCAPFKCAKAMTPLQSTCSTMNSEWFVDGDFVLSGDASASYCFDWGWHDVELRYTCLESGLTSSSVQTFYCGPRISTASMLIDLSSEWLPFYFSVEAEVDADCGLTINGPRPIGTTSSFNPFEAIIDPSLAIETGEEVVEIADSFEWSIKVRSADDIIINTYNHNSLGSSAIWEGPVRITGDFQAIEEVCFELTGPDWLVQNSPNLMGYCVDVTDCTPPLDCTADLNDDGAVTVIDLLLVLEGFGSNCD